MPPSAIARKLLLKPNQRLLLLNAPEEGLLGELPQGATVSTAARGEFDAGLAFVKDLKELEAHAPKLFKAVKHDGLTWLVWPKKSAKTKSDLTRDVIWKWLAPRGYAGVANVAIDDTWSAFRFRPSEKVGK